MVRKTVGYVELEWTCEHCGTGNPGPRKFCNNCGAPQPHDVEFHQAEEEVLLTDAAEIEKAKAGPDVHCPYCRARNAGGASFCGACGGDLKDAEARASGQVLGAHRSGKALEVACPSCGTLNLASMQECAGCGDSLEQPSPPPTDKPTDRTTRSLPIALIAGIAIGCLLLIVGLVILLSRTEEQSAVVQDVSWSRSIPIEMLTEVEEDAWADEVPANAEILSCTVEYRTTLSEPAANAVEICGTPYTVDTGSGYGEVVQDCVYEVYDDFCTYTALDWVTFDTVTVTGNDLDPYWPSYSLGENQRAGEGEQDLIVVFRADGDTLQYQAGDETEFARFVLGSRWLLEVNTFGTVVSATAE